MYRPLAAYASSPVFACACASADSRCPVEWPRSWTFGASQPPHGCADDGSPTFSRKVCRSRSASMNTR
nr:hypothetical protein [Actinomadura nitritigenes]